MQNDMELNKKNILGGLISQCIVLEYWSTYSPDTIP